MTLRVLSEGSSRLAGYCNNSEEEKIGGDVISYIVYLLPPQFVLPVLLCEVLLAEIKHLSIFKPQCLSFRGVQQKTWLCFT